MCADLNSKSTLVIGLFWSYKEITKPTILYDYVCVANWNLSIIVCTVWSQQQDAALVQPAYVFFFSVNPVEPSAEDRSRDR